ncbi:MAG: putative anti-sigma-F factor NrsF [Luteibacter sp.]|uniref:DUF1109 domain-containing protein n=1 Tax=Luteibacter sp. TaxID=1886636 RepID=UPI00137D9A36|nr:DUF1109 domain-containing protein [Luteibacter sp.]KAF1008284.1 MAG: putative anti-sigma-F factor NrsF [Luteibacter sp.]
MKTDDLISLLASEAPAIDRRQPTRRYALAVVAGLGGALLLMAVLLGLRPDIAEAIRLPMFWWRMGYAASIAAGALWALSRLARPGLRVGPRWSAIALPIFLAWLAAATILAGTLADERIPLVLGHTWKVCAILIATLSTPAFVAMLYAVRGMAPTRPRTTGATIGLFAGATATVAYCLHCPEMAPPFWSVWYLTGMLIPALVGAVIGPRVLRW